MVFFALLSSYILGDFFRIDNVWLAFTHIVIVEIFALAASFILSVIQRDIYKVAMLIVAIILFIVGCIKLNGGDLVYAMVIIFLTLMLLHSIVYRYRASFKKLSIIVVVIALAIFMLLLNMRFTVKQVSFFKTLPCLRYAL